MTRFETAMMNDEFTSDVGKVSVKKIMPIVCCFIASNEEFEVYFHKDSDPICCTIMVYEFGLLSSCKLHDLTEGYTI
jgi:hypothetical protein